MMKMLKIGTHNGHFHADEVLACALLRFVTSVADPYCPLKIESDTTKYIYKVRNMI